MKPKFNIGDLVKAYPSCIDFDTSEDINEHTKIGRLAVQNKNVIYKDTNNPIVGVIVGAVYRYMGKLHIAKFKYDHYGEYEGDENYLEKTKAVLFWKIREGYLNKSKEALESDIKLIKSVHSDCITIKGKNKKPPIPWKRGEKNLSLIMKRHPAYFPRDEKGRFRKIVPNIQQG